MNEISRPPAPPPEPAVTPKDYLAVLDDELGSQPQAPAPGADRSVRSLMKRYTDAFRVARTTVLIGRFLQVCGLAIGGMVALGVAWLVATQIRELLATQLGESAFYIEQTYLLVAGIFAGIFVGLIVALPLYVLGTLACAQGQHLMATLDTAVNSSPFLKKAEMAQIMSLR